MKRLLILLLLLAVFIAGFGLYRGWFTVNQPMIEQDEQAAQEELHNLEQKLKDKTSDLRGHDPHNK